MSTPNPDPKPPPAAEKEPTGPATAAPPPSAQKEPATAAPSPPAQKEPVASTSAAPRPPSTQAGSIVPKPVAAPVIIHDAGGATPPPTTTETEVDPTSEPEEVEEREDLAKQERENDFSGEWGKRQYCERHFKSFLPLLIILLAGGRFAFAWKKQTEGTYAFKFKIVRMVTIHFLVMTGIMYIMLLLGLWNVADILLNVTKPTGTRLLQRECENVLVRRYFVPLIFVYSSLLHGCIAAALMIRKRHYIAHYFTFWSRAVYTMHMDVHKSGRGFAVKVLATFGVVVVTLIILTGFKFGPTTIGLPTIFGDLSLRQMLPKTNWLEIEDGTTRRKVQAIGGFLLIFIFTSTKSTVLMFIYHCKTLQSAFAYWNGRVYASVLRGGEFAQTEEGRTTYKLLFKDHCVLMDLMEGLDQVYAHSLESYFGLQIFSLFFELYFFIRSAKHGDDRNTAANPDRHTSEFFIRPNDWAPGVMMIFVSVSLMVTAIKSAASVAEEAMAGLEVLRRRTMLGRKTDDELYFILSMFSSYTAYKKMEISAGGYSYFNKDFLIGVTSQVLSYFIILYQFQPVMDWSYKAEDAHRERFGRMLHRIEHIEPKEHYQPKKEGNLWAVFKFNVTTTTAASARDLILDSDYI